jgi:hypothetical protein
MLPERHIFLSCCVVEKFVNRENGGKRRTWVQKRKKERKRRKYGKKE